MDAEYLPEFGGTYLEGSYFMGMVCEGPDLHLDVLFALTLDHPECTPPLPGEQHCYRRGRLVLTKPSVRELEFGTRPSVLRDPDGTLDLGSIELHRTRSGAFLIVTEWFKLIVEVQGLDISIPAKVS